MNLRKISVLKLLKSRIAMMAALMLVVIACFVSVILMFINFDYEDQKMVAIMGKQRTYTQIMAKSAFEVNALLNSITVESENQRKQDLEQTKAELEHAMKKFDTNLLGIDNGYLIIGSKKVRYKITSPELLHNINDTSALWTEFKAAATTVLNENDDNQKGLKALTFIEENNRKLLDDSDIVVTAVIEAVNEYNKIWLFIAVFLAAISVVIIAIVMQGAYKQIFRPLDELYEGMTHIGVTQSDFKTAKKPNRYFEPLISEVRSMFNRLKNLMAIISNVSQSESFKETLDYIYSTFSNYIPYHYIGIALLDDDGKTLAASYGVSNEKINGLPQGLLGYSAEINSTSLGKLLSSGHARVINDLVKYTENKPLKEYNRIIMESGIKSSIAVPLKVNEKPLGVIFFSSVDRNVYNESHAYFLETLSNSIAISFNKNILINDIVYGSTLALAKLAESRDKDTGEHLQRIKSYSRFIAQLLLEEGYYTEILTPEYIADIEKFSSLHDIGKVAIQDNILLKPGKLTDEEFNTMKYHTVYGAMVLKEADRNITKSSKSLFGVAIEIAEYHHEKWDGTGYPHGLKGNSIPLSARIIAIADVFDALTSKRPYKDAFSFEKTCEIILEGNGCHFDPGIVKVFIEHKDRFYEVYQHFFKGENVV